MDWSSGHFGGVCPCTSVGRPDLSSGTCMCTSWCALCVGGGGLVGSKVSSQIQEASLLQAGGGGGEA